MRFLLALDNFSRPSGGAQSSARDLALKLLGRGHEVAILESGRAEERLVWQGAILRRVKLQGKKLLPDRDLRTLLLKPLWKSRVAASVREWRPSMVITQGYLAPGSIEAAREAGVPTAYFSRGYGQFCPIQFQGRDPAASCRARGCLGCLPWKRRLLYPLAMKALELQRRAITGADLVVANSGYMAGLFADFWGVRAEVIYPTLELPVAAAPENDPNGWLLFVKPQRIKGLELFAGLARALPERLFAVAGHAGRGAARRLSGMPNVRLLGWRSDMERCYRESRLLLGLPIWPEPFGRIYAEAAGSGCPSVAFAVGGVPEAVGKGGVLMPPGAGIGEWVRTIRSLDDPGRYESLRQEALKNARRLLALDGSGRLMPLLEAGARRGESA